MNAPTRPTLPVPIFPLDNIRAAKRAYLNAAQALDVAEACHAKEMYEQVRFGVCIAATFGHDAAVALGHAPDRHRPQTRSSGVGEEVTGAAPSRPSAVP